MSDAMKTAVKLSDLFPSADLFGNSWAHQWSAARRKKHRDKTKWVGDKGRKVAAEQRERR